MAVRFPHLRKVFNSLFILLLAAAGCLALPRHGWRFGLLGCDAAAGGYLCGMPHGRTVVFAPGFREGQETLGEEVGWLSLMAIAAGVRLGVVDASPDQLIPQTKRFIAMHGGEALLGFSLGGRATLSLAESGLVEHAAVVCAPADLAAVMARFSTLTATLEAAGVVGPDSRLRENFDAWRAVYDSETLPAIQALDQALVDGWLVELEMPWTNDWARYLAIRSAFWLDGRASSAMLASAPQLTGDLQADLFQIHNRLDPVVPISQADLYQEMAASASAGERITVRVIEGFGHCRLGPGDWWILKHWMQGISGREARGGGRQ